MARTEQPLDPGEGPVAELAHELRALRQRAGNPTYRAMAQSAHFSATVLSRAASGRQLPTLAVVVAYARACGEDPEPWEQRWQQVREQLTERAEQDEGCPPYLGLTHFDIGDTDRFFGRDALVDRLVETVRGHRLVGVIGASGSGKSSLVRAGLVPAVIAAAGDPGRAPEVVVITPGPAPIRQLAEHALAPAVAAASTGAPENGSSTARGPERKGSGSWRLVVVDQFEEVYTLCGDPGQRQEFIDGLLDLTRPEQRTRVVITVRGDYYGHCGAHPGLAEALSSATLLVGPMTAEELREAIVRPATEAGFIVERELTARIVADVLGRPGALPMLSHTLLQVWRRRSSRLLSLEAYERLGGVQGALATTAETLYTGLTPGQAAAARRILLRLINPGEHGPDTRRPAALEEVSSGASAGCDLSVALQQLTDARMITVADGHVELAHEALIDGWPRLQDWLDADRETLRQHRALGQAAASWRRDGHDPDALYRGNRLTVAEQLFAGPEAHGPLTRDEQEFLTASLRARDAEQLASSRSRRRLQVLAASLAGLLVLAASIGYVAVRTRQDARREQVLADTRRVAGVAQGMSAFDPALADLLAVAAYRVTDTYESRSALLAALNRPERASVHLPAGWSAPMTVLSGDGRLAVTADQGSAEVLRIADGRTTSVPGVPGRAPQLIAVSADGHTLVSGTQTSTTVWNTARGRLRTLPVPWSSVLAGFSDSGRIVAVFDRADATLTVQDLNTGSTRLSLRLPGVVALAVSPDDRTLAACVEGGPPQVWTVPAGGGGSRPLPLASGGSCTSASTLSFGRSGLRLALGTDTTGATVWDLRTGRVIAGLPAAGTAARLSPDGNHVLAVDDGVSIWRVGDRQRVLSYRTVGQSPRAVLWVDDRTVRYLDGTTIRTLDVAHATEPTAVDTTGTDTTVLSPDGSTVIRTAPGPTGYGVRIRSAAGGPATDLTLPLPAAAVTDPHTYPLVSVSQDGGTIALGVLAGQATPWLHQALVVDLPGRTVRATLDVGAGDPILGLTVSHDGSFVAVLRGPLHCQFGCTPTGLQIWDVAHHALRARVPGIVPSSFRFTVDDHWLVTNVGVFDLAPLTVPPTRQGDPSLPGEAFTPERRLPDVDSDYFAGIAASPDGRLMALADDTGRILLRDAHTWALRATLNRPMSDNLWPQAAGSPFQVVAFSHDGTLLASATSAGIDLWDLAQARLLGSTIPTRSADLQDLAFSADDHDLVVAGATSVQTIRIAPTDTVHTLCTRAGRDLTRAEWLLYLPQQPFHSVCSPAEISPTGH